MCYGKKSAVVDDERLIVKGIKFSLVQDDMEVDCAYDGEEALEMVKRKEYDIDTLESNVVNTTNAYDSAEKKAKRAIANSNEKSAVDHLEQLLAEAKLKLKDNFNKIDTAKGLTNHIITNMPIYETFDELIKDELVITNVIEKLVNETEE